MKKTIATTLVRGLIGSCFAFATGVLYEQGRKIGRETNFLTSMAKSLGNDDDMATKAKASQKL